MARKNKGCRSPYDTTKCDLGIDVAFASMLRLSDCTVFRLCRSRTKNGRHEFTALKCTLPRLLLSCFATLPWLLAVLLTLQSARVGRIRSRGGCSLCILVSSRICAANLDWFDSAHVAHGWASSYERVLAFWNDVWMTAWIYGYGVDGRGKKERDSLHSMDTEGLRMWDVNAGPVRWLERPSLQHTWWVDG